MKKLLVLLVVLGITAGASAVIIQPVISSLNGQAIDPVTEITIMPSDVINFDLVLIDAAGMILMSLDAIVGIIGPGTLDATDLTWPYNEGMNGQWVIEPGVTEEVATASFMMGMGEGILIDHFLMHCDEIGTVIITASPGYMVGGTILSDGMTMYDGEWGTATVFQTPEPATMVLLGLGGLLLRRKK